MRDDMVIRGYPNPSPATPGIGELAAGVAAGRQISESVAKQMRQLSVVVAVTTAMLGLVGFAVSFDRVRMAAQPSFGDLAPLVPLGIDLGILVFSLTSLVLAFFSMPARWLRLVPAGLTAATIYLNTRGFTDADGRTDWFAVIGHAVLPLLWVVAVAVAEHVIRHRLAPDDDEVMDAVRVSRWLLAPVSTALLRRRMVLWEERSYEHALGKERRRLLAVASLRDTYGLLWRVKAPRKLRVLERLGDLLPEQVSEAAAPKPRKRAEPKAKKGPDTSMPPPAEQPGDEKRTEDPVDTNDPEPVERGTKRQQARGAAVAYRSKNHALPSVSELMELTGIPQRTCERAIRDLKHVTVLERVG